MANLEQQFTILLDRLDRIAEQMEHHTDQFEKVEHVLFGVDGDLGLTQRVAVMWRIHVWILCTISAACGSIMTALLIGWLKG